MSFRKSALLCTSAMAALWISPPQAEAQQSSQLVMEEIVVTARKREENLQEIPVTVTAFSSNAIERFDITDLFDIAALTPGLDYEDIGWRNGEKPSIRGITTPSTVPQQQKASVFIDGVYVSGTYSSNSLLDLERVEVLKGPQSAFFGRSTFAGAINYVTRDPGNEVDGKVVGSIASYGEMELGATVGGAIIDDTLFAQVTGYYFEFDAPDAWVNVPDGHRNGSQQTEAISGKLIYEADDLFRIEARASYNADNDGHLIARFTDPGDRNGRFTRPDSSIGEFPVGSVSLPTGPFQFNFDQVTNPGIDRKRSRFSVEASTMLADHDLTLVWALNEEDQTVRSDLDVTEADSFRSFNDQEFRDTSVEVRLTSPQDQRFRYMLGGYYWDFTQRNKNLFQFNLGFFVLDIPTDSKEAVQNLSVFGGLYYDITDDLTLTFEARYQNDDVSSENFGTGIAFQNDFNAFLPRVNLEYRVSDDVLVYGVASKGNNPGLFNTGTTTPEDLRVVNEETIWNYELGLKSTWMDGRLLVNAAAFYMDWTDQQFRRSFDLPGGTIATAIVNEGNSEVKGFELETSFIPADGWDLRGTLSYNDAQYTNFCSTNLFQLTGVSDQPPPNFCVEVDGNNLEAQPVLSGSLSAGYTGVISEDVSWFARSDLIITGKKYASEMNLAHTGTAHVVNARVGVNNGPFLVELFGRNITNEKSPVRVGRLSDRRLGSSIAENQNTGVVIRRPWQVGARVAYNF